MRDTLRQHRRFFLIATLAGLVLRLLFLFRFPAVTSDSFVYGDIAKNWLRYGIFGLSGIAEITPTYIRLPGYPAFLAAIFAMFGIDHYRAVLLIQMFVDLGTCFLIADIAYRTIGERAARAAFLLAALCPFLANFAAAALTETWEIFFTSLALDCAVIGLEKLETRVTPWFVCGLAVGAAILLRPDGGLLLGAIAAYLLFLAVRTRKHKTSPGMAVPRRRVHAALTIFAIVALAPLIPWTWRNFSTFHEFQPLVPRYANEENAFVPLGFNRWVKTWMVDYASVEEVYWPVPGHPIDADQLPARAFDSPEQRDQTQQLIDDYNAALHITPDLDARFGALAEQRIRHAPLRYYVRLPVLRIADMWLRPRTEILPCNTRWWEFDEDPKWLVLSIALGVTNLLYVGAAIAGLVREKRIAHLGLLLTFVLLRSAFLGTMENPEPRYTLECYPLVIVLAAALW